MAQAEISEDEAKLYDRQIRLWGLEAQKRMRNSKVLLVGLRGLITEVTKNVVLSGIGTAYLLDPAVVTVTDLSAQFFLTHEDIGKNRAEASAPRVQDLNPRVNIVVDKDPLESKSPEFFQQFDIVCLSDCSLATTLKVNQICRQHKIPIFSGALHGYFGFVFMDHNQHNYQSTTKSVSGEETTTIKTLATPSFQDVFDSPWNIPALRRVSKSLLAEIILLHYTSVPDQGNILDFKKEYLNKRQVAENFVEDQTLLNVWQAYHKDLSPVAAIVGGLVAQEVIKLLSGKDDPIVNCFVFDGLESRGLVEYLGSAPVQVTRSVADTIEL